MKPKKGCCVALESGVLGPTMPDRALGASAFCRLECRVLFHLYLVGDTGRALPDAVGAVDEEGGGGHECKCPSLQKGTHFMIIFILV